MNAAIETKALRKSFGHTRALDGLDLTVETGEVHGFLGPNGAGKTTTLRLLLGLLRADDGEMRLLGGDPWRDAVSLHRRLAEVVEDPEERAGHLALGAEGPDAAVAAELEEAAGAVRHRGASSAAAELCEQARRP